MSIDEVIFKSRGIDHEDERRTLYTAFNGDIEGFEAAQVKFAVLKQYSELGGHYHDYGELFYLLDGHGDFNLKDIDSDLEVKYELVKGDMLYIPKRIAHKAKLESGTILVGCTEVPYISPEFNDQKYDF